MDEGRCWQPGEHVLLRDIRRQRVTAAIPMTVVEHSPERLVAWLCVGTPFAISADWDRKLERDYANEPGTVILEWESAGPGQLYIVERGAHHAVIARFGADWRFDQWYINLQTPVQPSPFGFDTRDQVLDVFLAPDCQSHQWKDEPELARAVDHGVVTPEEAKAIRDEGARVIERAADGARPFNEPWPEWRPPTEWKTPRLPEGWEHV